MNQQRISDFFSGDQFNFLRISTNTKKIRNVLKKIKKEHRRVEVKCKSVLKLTNLELMNLAYSFVDTFPKFNWQGSIFGTC